MQLLDNNTQAFLALVKAGLWEKEVSLSAFGEVNFREVMRLAEEQSIVGLITAGLEHVNDEKIPQEVLLQYIGSTLQIEQRNKAMNDFVADLVERMRLCYFSERARSCAMLRKTKLADKRGHRPSIE